MEDRAGDLMGAMYGAVNVSGVLRSSLGAGHVESTVKASFTPHGVAKQQVLFGQSRQCGHSVWVCPPGVMHDAYRVTSLRPKQPRELRTHLRLERVERLDRARHEAKQRAVSILARR